MNYVPLRARLRAAWSLLTSRRVLDVSITLDEGPFDD